MATFNNPSWLQSYANTPTAAETGAQWSNTYIKPFSDIASNLITSNRANENKAQIDKIIAEETTKANIKPGMTPVTQDAEGNLIASGKPGTGELDYRSLERRLLPYDQALSEKYGILADKQDVVNENNKIKREQIASDEKIKQDAVNAKKQALSNKFDLSTEEGKVAWKEQFNKIQTAMYQPGFNDADPTTVKEPMRNAAQSLIKQAQDYPELLASVGLKPSENKEENKTKNDLGSDHPSNIKLIDSKLEDLKYKTDNTHDILSFIQRGNISQDERDLLSAYVVDQMTKKPPKPIIKKKLTDQQVIDEYAKTMGPAALALTSQKFNLFGAGVQNLRNGIPGTAVQNFIKAANPGEAVMADDIVMANKGSVAALGQGLLGKLGFDATNLTVTGIAEKLKQTAEVSINNTIESLKSSGMTPEQIKLFIVQKLNGDFVLKNLGNNPTVKSLNKSKTYIINGKKVTIGEE